MNLSRYTGGLMILLVLTGVYAFSSGPAYNVVPGSQIKVSGTSSLHDWDMTASSFSVDANFTLKGTQLQNISSLNLVLPVKSLKSGESLMDTRAYKALNEEKFDKITFKLTDVVIIPQQKIVKAKGSLTIAGVTNDVDLQTSYVVNGDETITFKGTKAIKMSDFKIKAPSFMMGALKTGDDLIIEINLRLKN